jgi:hypothetical protein
MTNVKLTLCYGHSIDGPTVGGPVSRLFGDRPSRPSFVPGCVTRDDSEAVSGRSLGLRLAARSSASSSMHLPSQAQIFARRLISRPLRGRPVFFPPSFPFPDERGCQISVHQF